MADIAAEVLPNDLNTVGAQRAVRSTPWRLRFTRRTRLVAASTALLVIVSGSVAALMPDEDRTVRVALSHPADTTRAWVMEIDPDAPWVEGEPINARAVAATGPLSVLAGRSATSPDRRDGMWLGTVKFMDAGGDDIAAIDASGAITRIASDSADDGGPSPAPDGSALLFSTRRFDRDGHQSELVRYHHETGSLTRITVTPDNESAAYWSPDGTRVLFGRRYTEQDRDTETCVMHLDGAAERCVWDGLPPGSIPVAWMSDKSALVTVPTARTMYRIDTESGEAVFVGRAPGTLTWLDGTELLLHVYYDPQTQQQVSSLSTLSQPIVLRPVLIDGRRFGSRRRMVLAGATPAPYLDRFAFEERDIRVNLESGAAVRVSGVNSVGIDVPIRALRFASADTAIARVRGDGLIAPQRIGQTWIRVTAGGWRTDSVRVTVSAGVSRTRIKESWNDGISRTWAPFGVPAPRVRTVDGVRVLEPRGDGKYGSGVYQHRPMLSRDGVGVDLRFRAPIARNKLENLMVMFHAAGDSAQLAQWDHRTTWPPIGESVCGLGLPWTEGGAAFKRIAVASATGETKFGAEAPPPDLFSDVWHTLRLQLTPDGRCALYLDGVFIARTDAPAHVPPSVRLMITAASGAKPVVVGDIEVWEGVRLMGGR